MQPAAAAMTYVEGPGHSVQGLPSAQSQLPPGAPLPGDQVRSFDGLVSALTDALPGLLSAPSVTAPPSRPPSTVAEVSELLQLLPQLLQGDPSPSRVGALLFGGQSDKPSLITVIFKYLTAPLAYAPGATGVEEAQRQLTQLRVLLLRTLGKVLSLASSPAAENQADPTAVALSEAAARAVVQARGIEVMLGIMCGGAHVAEEAKVATVECLFVFLMRNIGGKHAVIATPGSVSHLLTALRTEKSHMTRNYTAACVLELANAYPAQIAGSEFPSVLCDIIQRDTSADVRVLAIETFDVLLRADAAFLSQYQSKSELSDSLCALLRGDDNREVRDIACRLLSTIFAQEGRQIAAINTRDTPLEALPPTVSGYWILAEGYKHMLTTVGDGPNGRVAGMAARAFRHLVQFAPWQLRLGHRLIENWGAIGALLKSLQPGSAPATDDIDAQIPLVELAIALGIVLAQSPHTRTALHRELCGFPAWLPTLRTVLLGHLNRAALEYYDGIDIWDCCGELMNSLESVQWDNSQPHAKRPKKASVRQVFETQKLRFAGAAPQQPQVAPSTQYDDAESAAQKRMRLTFIMISYAIHLALSPPPHPVEQPPQAPVHAPVAASPVRGTSGSGTSSSVTSSGVSDHRGLPAAPTMPQHVQQIHAAMPPPMPCGVSPPASHAAPPPVPGSVQSGPPPATAWGPAFVPPASPGFSSRGVPAGNVWGTPQQPRPVREMATPCGVAAPSAPAAQLPQPRSHWDDVSGAASPRPPAGAQQLQPMFPSYPSSLSPSAAARRADASTQRHTRMQQHAAAASEVYSKFDHALKLALHFAEYHNRKQQTRPTYKPTSDGYMIRQTKLRDPWCPIVQKKPLKSWSVRNLREGDLFYFAIPFSDVTVAAADQVSARAQKHLTNIKRLFLTTPQRDKGRRWFLFDMLNNIVPGITSALKMLKGLLHRHGEENVKFPLLMFREQEMHEGERSIHPGNLIEVTDQVRFYFTQQPGDLAGVNVAYIRDIDARIRALAGREFSGYEDDLSSGSSSGGEAGAAGADDSSSTDSDA
eukprot:TRINITY_DN12618_c0_g1_i1.p1 TRINITY_DN12618_c0_g1~~TRINITY_DN12618_c0_g1_i1.p1  ORF type:complete len:1045 (+),score=228.75 TRINITY_DN12618_c0_g1_i1:90-3224(+)